MPKDRTWIERDLLPAWSAGDSEPSVVELYRGGLSTRAYRDKSIGAELSACETRWGSLSDLVARVVSGQRGLWFFAAWHDQAALEVGKVMIGDERLWPIMRRQFDDAQAEQGGDMVAGYAPYDADWVWAIEVSPERHTIVVSFRGAIDASPRLD